MAQITIEVTEELKDKFLKAKDEANDSKGIFATKKDTVKSIIVEMAIIPYIKKHLKIDPK